MRQYLLHGALPAAERTEFDVVIVGSGVAGLYAALNLDKNLSCAVINKSGDRESNSMYAQGGVAAVIDEQDLFESHFEDTLTAGAGLCDREAVGVLVREGPGDIHALVSLGVPFDTDAQGRLKLTREGAHHFNRIVHSGGDATGLHITRSLLTAAGTRANIHMLSRLALVDIVTDENGETAGVVVMSQQNRPAFIASRRVILATGGIGHVYRNSTNARCATGDGIAAALRAGAAAADMEFVQFHPTALIHPDQSGRFFLISEALRGEGAILRNRKSEAFMQGVHPMADLAPRDIVSRAIIAEMKRSDIPNVYLDITAKPREFLRSRFPTIYEECMSRDIDIAMTWIPVVPVQHYFMGGIKTGLDGKTNIPGLYACGESACTGVHGANRLASNSLLECLVFGRRCAQDISHAHQVAGKQVLALPKAPEKARNSHIDVDSIRTRTRNTMTLEGGIIRSREGLARAISLVGDFLTMLDSSALNTVREFETQNMATVGLEILKAALRREKSAGAHYRGDAIA